MVLVLSQFCGLNELSSFWCLSLVYKGYRNPRLWEDDLYFNTRLGILGLCYLGSSYPRVDCCLATK